VVNDGTRGLVQSGIIVLGIPATWGSGTPPGMNASAALNWMRVRVAFGQFLPAPNISDVSLNVVPALAVQTVSNESVNFGSDKTLRNATLSQTPVLPESLTVTVFNDPLSPTEETEWTEVPDIQQARPDQKVYEFDPATGEITFGDGVHGAAVPQGFRNVFATYQVISPSTGVLGAGAANTLISSAPNVTGVTNPDPGSGGTQVGTQAEAIGRGPQLFRAQGRAVTTADFAFLATQTAGIVRATAIAGRHPAYPGNPIPGVVGVYVVPPDTNPTFGQGPAPIPNAATLGAVAGFLSGNAALAGVDVVAAAPVFRYVRAQVSVAASAAVATSVYQNVLAALVTYLHPETGGADGTGWPFGAPLLYTPLVLFLTSVPGVTGISSLTLEIDGQRLPPCSDFAIGADSLFWSLQHQIVPDMGEGGS